MAGYELGDEAIRQIAEGLRRINALPEPAKNALYRRHGGSAISSAVPVRNDSGEEIPAFGLMRITGTTTVDGEPVWTVDKPSSTFQRFVLVNGETAIPASGSNDIYGTGYFCDRPFRALYDTSDGTPSYGQVWGPRSGSWKLRRHHYGFLIWGEIDDDTTGEETVKVTQSLVVNVIGKTDAAITKGSSGTVSVWKGDESADTSIDITGVTIPFASAAAGAWVRVVWDAETPSATAVECSVTTTTTTTTGVPTTTTTAVPTTTLAPSSTTLAPTSTTLAPTTTTVSPSLRYFCTVVAGADCATATGVACQAGDDAGNPPAEIPVCSGPYVSLAECESSCSVPTSTTLAPTSTTAGPTTAAPTTTLAPTTTSTTAAPVNYYCWDCFGIHNCGRDLMEACGGSGSGPIAGPYPGDSTCGGGCA